MNNTLVSKDIYVVINKTILNDSDREILFMLYQPIIGASPINLYFTLWSELDKNQISSEEHLHSELSHKIGININSLLESRMKLEAVGLLKSYVKKDTVNSYIYELYSPLSPNDFFENPILNSSLITNLGKGEYQKTVSHFSLPKIDMKGYENVSTSFGDVFEIASFTPNEGLYDEIRKRSINNIEISHNIDLNIVLDMIPDEMLNKKSLTKEIKDLIYKLSFIYNLNNDEIRDLICESLTIRKTIDKDKLREKCGTFYSFENYGSSPTIIYRTQPENLRSSISSTSKKAKIIYTFESTSPHDYLLSKYNGSSLSKADTKLLEHLMIDMNLKAGVVNVLIDYVLRINDNKLIPKFVEAIASQWKMNNIETVEEAMDLAKKEYQARNKTKKSSSPQKEPSWMSKVINSTDATDKEKEEMEELLSEFK